MTSPDSPSQTPMPPKRGLWWKILLAVVVLIILLVLLLPTLLSTGPGKAIVLGQVNKRMPGKQIKADSMSLGWFSGATIQKFQFIDTKDGGKTLIAADAINTSITVWDAITGSTIDLKDVKVVHATMPDRPEVVVAVKLVGNADLGKKVLNFTGPSEITATDQKTSNVTKLEIPAGSVASWGDLANDIHAVITYHLPDIQPLLAASLPKDAVLEGSYTMPIHVVGALSKDPGLRALRGFKIDETKVGEGRIYMDGFDVGKAEIPYHMENGVLVITPTDLPFKDGGRIRVRGKIDFNADPPAFIIDTPDDPAEPFIKDLPLNHKIAAGKLRFFPLLWGDTSGNFGEINGKVNVRLDSVNIPLDAAAFKTKGTLAGALSIHDLTTDAPFFSQITKVIAPVANLGNLDLGSIGKGGKPGGDIFAIRGGTIPDVPFALANGKVSYQNLRLGTAIANLTFSGSVGLDNSLAMNMEFATKGVSIPIPIGLKGTTSKPELTLSGKLPTQDLGKNLEKTLKEGPDMIDRLFKDEKK